MMGVFRTPRDARNVAVTLSREKIFRHFWASRDHDPRPGKIFEDFEISRYLEKSADFGKSFLPDRWRGSRWSEKPYGVESIYRLVFEISAKNENFLKKNFFTLTGRISETACRTSIPRPDSDSADVFLSEKLYGGRFGPLARELRRRNWRNARFSSKITIFLVGRKKFFLSDFDQTRKVRSNLMANPKFKISDRYDRRFS